MLNSRKRLTAVLFWLLLLCSAPTQASPLRIGDTGFQVEPPSGWNQQINPQTGNLRLVSPDGVAIVDFNPARDGTGLNGDHLVESKATATENVLHQNGMTLSLQRKQFKERDGATYLYKTYETRFQNQDYVVAMMFLYTGEHTILTNTFIPKELAINYLSAIEKKPEQHQQSGQSSGYQTNSDATRGQAGGGRIGGGQAGGGRIGGGQAGSGQVV